MRISSSPAVDHLFSFLISLHGETKKLLNIWFKLAGPSAVTLCDSVLLTTCSDHHSCSITRSAYVTRVQRMLGTHRLMVWTVVPTSLHSALLKITPLFTQKTFHSKPSSMSTMTSKHFWHNKTMKLEILLHPCCPHSSQFDLFNNSCSPYYC